MKLTTRSGDPKECHTPNGAGIVYLIRGDHARGPRSNGCGGMSVSSSVKSSGYRDMRANPSITGHRYHLAGK